MAEGLIGFDPRLEASGIPETTPTPMLDFSTRIIKGISDFQEAGAKESAFLRSSAERQRTEAKDVQETMDRQAKEREDARPATPTLPTPPDTSPRPFLAPGPSVMSQIQAAITGVTQVVTGIGGLRGGGYAIGAVSGLKGALEGWAAGDHERAKAALRDWETNSEKLQQDYRNRLERYREILTDQKTTMDNRLAMIGLQARADGNEALANAVDKGDVKGVIDILQEHQKHVDSVGIRRDQLAFSMKKEEETLAERKREAEAREAQAAENAKDKVVLAKQHDETLRYLGNLQAESRRELGQMRTDLSSVKGGPWVNKTTGEIVDRITNSEWNEQGGNTTFKPITKQQMATIDILKGEAMPQLDQMNRIGEQILSTHKGANLAKILELEARGKLSDDLVRQYGQARFAAASALGRAFSGQPTLRKFVIDQLMKTEVSSLGDTRQTLHRMTENSRMAVVNFSRSAKGWEPFAMPSATRTVEAVNEAGEIAKIKLAPYEPLPEGWQYRF